MNVCCPLNMASCWSKCWFTRGYTLWENWPSSQQLTVANNSFVTGGNTYTSLVFMLGFWLDWACTALVHAVTTAVSPCVQLPYVESTVCHCHLLSQALAVSLSSSCPDLWSLGGNSAASVLHLEVSILQSLILGCWALWHRRAQEYQIIYVIYAMFKGIIFL